MARLPTQVILITALAVGALQAREWWLDRASEPARAPAGVAPLERLVTPADPQVVLKMAEYLATAPEARKLLPNAPLPQSTPAAQTLESRVDATFENRGYGPLLRQFLLPADEDSRDESTQAELRRRLFENPTAALKELGEILEQLPPEAGTQRTPLLGLVNEMGQVDETCRDLQRKIVDKEIELALARGIISAESLNEAANMAEPTPSAEGAVNAPN